jgi:phosphoribosylanthranilate isomerase
MTRIKICGLTRAEDVALASELGADFLGFVFVTDSPRYITPEQVRAIVSSGAAGFSLPGTRDDLPSARRAEAHRSTWDFFTSSRDDR